MTTRPTEVVAAEALVAAMVDEAVASGDPIDPADRDDPEGQPTLAAFCATTTDHDRFDRDRAGLDSLLVAAVSAAGGGERPFARFLEAPPAIHEQYAWYVRQPERPERDRALAVRCVLALSCGSAAHPIP